MAKKTSKKTPAKKAPPTKKAGAKKSPVKKAATTKKPATKKSPPKKAPAKKAPVAKKVAKAAPTKKAPAKASPPKKAATKKTPIKKPPAKKPLTKKTPVKKVLTKKVLTKKVPVKKAAASKTPAQGGATDAKTDGKPNRKGITIVNDKPKRRSAPKKPVAKFPPAGPRLLGPDSPVRRPLIPSGPRDEAPDLLEGKPVKPRKTKLTKTQLDEYHQVLVIKRAQLLGVLTELEAEALRSDKGGSSSLPQHLAEQGSDSADQTMSLNLAEADRRLIREIDGALQRIADRTFGVCELTGKPIPKARLEELPWARYTIEAAERMERGQPRHLP